ncbi:MAG: AIR synthase family protein [Bacillota bacterium]
MEVGKLSNDELKNKIFKNLDKKRDDVLLSSSVGQDCAAIDFGKFACLLSTDPITGAKEEIGKISVNVASNDIATAGVAPTGLMMTILAPSDTTVDDLEYIVKQANDEAQKNNIEIVGGHTEITNAVNQVIISMTAIGKKEKSELLKPKNVDQGDSLIITKFPGIEGTGILAFDKADELSRILSKEEIKNAKSFLDDTSVIKEGIISDKVGVKLMHDVTEGGLLGALWEVCTLSKVGCHIKGKNIEINKITKKVCEFYSIDPFKLISSGVMLIVVSKDKTKELINKFSKENIECYNIGEIKPKEFGKKIEFNKGLKDILSPESDELYKVIG